MIAQPSDPTSTTAALWPAIRAKLRSLSLEHQQQVLDFVEFLAIVRE